MLKVGEYGKENERRPRTGLVNQGKARNITSERLAEINSLTTHEYFIYEEENTHPKTTIYNDTIEGNITIDVYGNIVSYGQTFGLTEPLVLNLGIIVLKFGLTIEITLASVIGVIIAILCSVILTLLFKIRDKILVWQKGVIRW